MHTNLLLLKSEQTWEQGERNQQQVANTLHSRHMIQGNPNMLHTEMVILDL
jgi:hypothetical protein